MSHFNVLVIGPKDEKEIENVLMPYCENTKNLPKDILEFDCYEEREMKIWNKNKKRIPRWYSDHSFTLEESKFLEVKNKKSFTLNKEDSLELRFCQDNGKCRVQTFITDPNDDKKRKWKSFHCEFTIARNKTLDDPHGVDSFIVTLYKIKNPIEDLVQVAYSTFDEYMQKHNGYNGRDEITGKYGYWRNRNAKWDWYSVGGRWDGWLILKGGGVSNRAKKCEIDWEKMRDLAIINAEKNWFEAMKEDKASRVFIYGIKDDDTEESYVKRRSDVETFAVVKNGKWHQRGKMGWWASVTDEKEHEDWYSQFTKFIEKTKDDEIITIVDCHI